MFPSVVLLAAEEEAMSSSLDTSMCGLEIFGSFPSPRRLRPAYSGGGGSGPGYERMHCSCLEAGGGGGGGAGGGRYERLPPSSPCDIRYSELRSRCDDHDKDGSNEKQEELVFYADDGGGRHSLVVEKDLCAGDLCQLLAAKSLVNKDPAWTIVEVWPQLGLERSLEDHEDVLSVHHDTEPFGRREEKKFVFRKDFTKYEFFHSPQQFFPADMVDLSGCDQLAANTDPSSALQALVANGGELPAIFAHVWVRDGCKAWNKAFVLLSGRSLYYSYKIQAVAKYLRSKDNKDRVFLDGGLQLLASLDDHQVYRTLNARNQFRAPTEWGLCLRPTGGGNNNLRCLACESERARLCWVTAMRLAKYGKQLRENYRAFKNKSAESGSSPKDYNSYTLPNESVRSRVAMDFTGSVGRIVEDPLEARAIAAAEGYSWKRRWRPRVTTTNSANAVSVVAGGLDAGIHVTQPWFHAGMTRDKAAALVARHGSVDGVFLVRESRSSPGSFVLTFKCGGKVMHTQIQPILDSARDTVCFSLDNGNTKFYDLLQLVEFYQLNTGRLPTRLTHYVVQGTMPSSIVNGTSGI